jgi:chitodextrinase
MKKTQSLILTFLLISFCFSLTTRSLAQTNIALTATVSTSYVSSWETLSAVNNNSSPANSNDKSTGAYGNWNNPNTIEWVEYDWSSSYTITKTEVYWFDDAGGVLTPTTAYVEYWNGSAWVNCGTVPKVKDAWNILTINSITTNKFRISMLNTSQSTGILEWRVWGTSSSCSPSAITPYTQINSGTWTQTSSASLAVGGSVKFGPQPTSGGSWAWTGPSNFSAATREITVSNIQTSQAGTYVATYTNSCGAKTVQNFTVTVTGGTTDTQAPTTPGTPTASNISSSGCTLTWTASTDNIGVTGYQVLRNGTAVNTVTGTTATISGLTAGTTYSFTVKAYDAAGNYSAASGATSVTTSTSTDTQAPTTPGTPTASNITSSGCTLSWTASTDNVAVTGYQVLNNGTSIMTVSGTTANVTGLAASTTYSFTVKAYDAAGNYSAASAAASVTTSGTVAGGDPYTWPTYSPNITYNYKDQYGTIATPTKVLDDCSGVVGTTSSDWWCFRWGANKNSLVTSNAINPMLTRFNKDFAYFRDIMGWPPDSRALNGYRSAIYLYGSGLCTDNASNTELGGWQSAVGAYPIVLASYYPVYSYDPACTYSDKLDQQSAMVHEGIHCVLASMPGCKNAAWFHEGGNTWLQQEAYSQQNGNYSSMGFLNGCSFLAPFMPIECYSGWLQDNSFGGPSAEGVNMFNGSQQICTWRTYLGGTQYGNAFPTFLGEVLGVGSVAWIWKNCPSRVLEGMAAGLGVAQLRRLITEYRAKQALLDMKQWSGAFKALLDAHFGQSIGAEWQPSWLSPAAWIATPYAITTNNGGILTPEARTLPGWSGANQIPLTISGNMVTVNFQPIGANMTCQLCYRATDGTAVYSTPVSSGNCSLRLDKAPANNVVIVVICNTDYIYNGESTRTAHYDYRLQLGTGVTGTADVHTKWYATTLKSAPVTTEGFDISKYCSRSFNVAKPITSKGNNLDATNMVTIMYPNPVAKNGTFNIEFRNPANEPKLIEISNVQGQVVYQNMVINNTVSINAGGLLKQGLYFVTVKTSGHTKTYKLMIE